MRMETGCLDAIVPYSSKYTEKTRIFSDIS